MTAGLSIDPAKFLTEQLVQALGITALSKS